MTAQFDARSTADEVFAGVGLTYGWSKTATSLFAVGRHRDRGIRAASVMPGASEQKARL